MNVQAFHAKMVQTAKTLSTCTHVHVLQDMKGIIVKLVSKVQYPIHKKTLCTDVSA